MGTLRLERGRALTVYLSQVNSASLAFRRNKPIAQVLNQIDDAAT
jgi:hypothetical protein